VKRKKRKTGKKKKRKSVKRRRTKKQRIRRIVKRKRKKRIWRKTKKLKEKISKYCLRPQSTGRKKSNRYRLLFFIPG
jgi:hypothetical protein